MANIFFPALHLCMGCGAGVISNSKISLVIRVTLKFLFIITNVFTFVQGYSSVLCVSVFKYVQVCSRVCKCIQVCSSMCKCVQVCSSVFNCVQVCASVFKCVQRCASVFNCVKGCSSVLCASVFKYV